MPQAEPIKVAIIGGGCASIATAFELSRPEHRGKYHVTVYQLGWRLGGKGASGRGPAGRIEEHGFHVWMGYYENAFRLMRECYKELNRDPRKCRIADWQDAFFPAPFVGLAVPSRDGGYENLLSYFAPGEGLPGDPLTEDNNPFSVTAYLTRTASILRTMLLTAQSRSKPGDQEQNRLGDDSSGPSGAGPGVSPEDASLRISRLFKYGLLATAAGLIEALGILQVLFARSPASPDNLVVRLLEAMASTARRQLEALLDNDPQLSLFWQVIDLGMTSMLGMVRFGLLSDPRGFDAINDYDFREWLRVNGASESSINSPLVRGCYDLAFAYEQGDYSRPRHAAGVALRDSLRMLFSSRGAFFWKMSAGMGDVVFAPFYEVLRKRGVSFRFFHRLNHVTLAELAELAPGERPYVKALHFDVQAEVKNGEYQPLADIDGLPCWPAKPDFSQLVNGDRFERENWNFESHWDRRKVGTRTLRVIDDFDFVVLGVSLGTIPFVCEDFLQRDPRWRDMVAHLKTVETQAFQIWMREDMEALGWDKPPVSLSAFAQPFETWADMRHLIKEERWPARPRAIAYFCSSLRDSETSDASDSDYPSRRREEVRQNAIRFLNNDIGHLWPKAVRGPGKFRWEILIDPNIPTATADADEARFDSQFWTANIDPSERYVLSLPGTPKYRISPLDNTYDNLTIAGDWTACGLDTGCVESAVMSGRLAAHAISSYPALEDIIGYDHP